MITTDINKVIYVSDGVTTEYDFNFTVYDKSHLRVYIQSPDTNKPAVLEEANYNVVLNDDYSGGKIILNNSLPQNTKISIIREVDKTQEIHYIEGSPFPAQSHERALDKLTMITQQLDEKVSRIPQGNVFDSGIDFDDLYNSIQYCSNNIEALAKSISITVNTIKDLIAIDTTNLIDKTAVLVLGYHKPNDGGGGIFYWDTQQDKSNHDGGVIIDPTAIFPTDWSDATQQNTWFNSSNIGNGCWVRQHNDVVYVEWFGAKGDGVNDDAIAIQKILNSFFKNIIFTQTYFVNTELSFKDKILDFKSGSKLISNSTTCAIRILYNTSRDKKGINGLRLYGNNYACNNGIIFEGGFNFIFKDIFITEVANDGLVFNTAGGSSENIVVNKLEIDSCGNNCLVFHNISNASGYYINEYTLIAVELRGGGRTVGTGVELLFKNDNATGSSPKISNISIFHINMDMRVDSITAPARDEERTTNGISCIKFDAPSGGIIEHTNFYDCTAENVRLSDLSTQFFIDWNNVSVIRPSVLNPLISGMNYYRNGINLVDLKWHDPSGNIILSRIADGQCDIKIQKPWGGIFIAPEEINTSSSSGNYNFSFLSKRYGTHIRNRIGLTSDVDTGLFLDTDNGDFAGNYSYIMKSAPNGNLVIGNSDGTSIDFQVWGNTKVSINNNDIINHVSGSGIILTSPNGTLYKITVDDAGNLVITKN